MILTIELTPEEEHRVVVAEKHGLDIYSLIRGVISGLPESSVYEPAETERLLAVDTACGAFAGEVSSEDFMQEKHRETEEEEARWSARYERQSA